MTGDLGQAAGGQHDEWDVERRAKARECAVDDGDQHLGDKVYPDDPDTRPQGKLATQHQARRGQCEHQQQPEPHGQGG